MLPSTSMQEPWKPGFSYTTACNAEEHILIWPEEQVVQPGRKGKSPHGNGATTRLHLMVLESGGRTLTSLAFSTLNPPCNRDHFASVGSKNVTYS